MKAFRYKNKRTSNSFHRMKKRNLKWLGLPTDTVWVPVDVADGLVWDYPVLAMYDPATEERCQIIHYAEGQMALLGEHANKKLWRHL